MPESPFHSFDSVICDGAVRSGKTLCMSVSFVSWAFASFSGSSFALCGKTIASLRRNVITVLLPILREIGFVCNERLSKNLVEIGMPIAEYSRTSGINIIMNAIGGTAGCSMGLELVDNGFRIKNTDEYTDYGYRVRLNSAGTTYLFFAIK